MKNNFTFEIFKFKSNLFVFQQINLLQKLIFILVYIFYVFCFIPILSVSFLVVKCIDKNETWSDYVDFIKDMFNDLMCVGVFFLYKYNYKWAWFEPIKVINSLWENEPEYKIEFWKKRQEVIERKKKIWDF